jgi:hypothetical protein
MNPKTSKLPVNAGSIFADSPLRSTTGPKKFSIVEQQQATEQPVAAQAVPTVNAPTTATEAVTAPAAAPALPVAPAPQGPPPPPSTTAISTTAGPPAEQMVKMTIYLTKSQADELEEVVYQRRRTGDRIGNTDLMREIVDEWRARRARRAAKQ